MTTAGLIEAVRTATGRPDARVVRVERTTPVHRVENMTTRALVRHRAEVDDGTTVRLFAKSLHPAACSPAWEHIPPVARPQVLVDLHWLDEPRLYSCGLADDLPPGLRFPALWHVEESPTCVTLWLEDVADLTPWDRSRYERTATALGALHARWPEARAHAVGLGRRDVGRLLSGKVANLDLVIQADDAFWDRPEIAAAVDHRHREDLHRLAVAAPELLARATALPHGAAHGDATPHNFHEPGDGTIVALDWSYGSVAPPGADLGQLLAGRYECGSADAAQLPEVAETVVAAYLAGADGEGLHLDRGAVELGLVSHLAIRSLFSALVLDDRADLDPTTLTDLVATRARMARFGLDLAFRVLDAR